MREAGLPVDKHGTWVRETSGGVQRDWLYTRMSRHVLEHHKPNLLLLHLVEVDHVEHRYGPRSPEAYWAVSYADDRLRDIVDAVESSPRKDQTTIIVASDHGFFPIERDICPNVLLRQAGINTADNRRVACVAQRGGGARLVGEVVAADGRQLEEQLSSAALGLGGLEVDQRAQLLGDIAVEAELAADLRQLFARGAMLLIARDEAREGVVCGQRVVERSGVQSRQLEERLIVLVGELLELTAQPVEVACVAVDIG